MEEFLHNPVSWLDLGFLFCSLWHLSSWYILIEWGRIEGQTDIKILNIGVSGVSLILFIFLQLFLGQQH